MIAWHGVAPHAGAWIETSTRAYISASRVVAPHAGAWIETESMSMICNHPVLSRPMRARGLKPQLRDHDRVARGRAPCGRVD